MTPQRLSPFPPEILQSPLNTPTRNADFGTSLAENSNETSKNYYLCKKK